LNGVYQNAINRLQVTEGPKVPAGVVIKQQFCSPNCTKDHHHNYLWDYTKNIKDDIDERPGVCFLLEMPVDSKDTERDDGNQRRYTVDNQSPLNLDSKLEIIDNF
jgi:hypothetical protein